MKKKKLMSACVNQAVKRSVCAVGIGGLLMVLGACSQTPEPEPGAETVTEESEAKPAKKQTRSKRSKSAPKAEEAKEVAPATAPSAPEECIEETNPGLVQTESKVGAPVEKEPSPAAVLGKRIAQVKVNGPYVAVTFDDGPHAALTPQVLDIFKRHGAHATFFVLGRNASLHRGILARAVAEGNEVGAHTWSHINMQASSEDKIISELDRTNAVIEKATGHRPMVMRPPYGSTNKKLVNMVYERYGTPSILWNVDTNDWRKPGVETVIRRAVNNASPGSIILLHDIHSSTIAAVERIVTGLQLRGFKLVTVSELLELGRQAKLAPAPAAENAPASSPPQLPLPTQQQQQQMMPATLPRVEPEGSASIGAVPAETAPVAEAAPAAGSVQETPAETHPAPAAISAGNMNASPVLL